MNRYPRRTTADRQAEASRYRQMTEEMAGALRTNIPSIVRAQAKKEQAIPVIPLKYCEYDKASKVLKLASEYFGMPNEFFVESHVTGKMVRFTVVNEHDILFDQDGWDGEQKVYRPVGNVPTVDHMYIYNT